MTAGVGPGAWTPRADHPDTTFEDVPKLLPLRVASEYDVQPGDVDPRGLTIYGADGEAGGKVVDLWIDMAETLFRYLEVEVEGGRRVLVPRNFVQVRRGRRPNGESRVEIQAVLGRQIAGAPGTRNPELVTMLEEEKIQAYFGAGLLYAEPGRTEPLA
jgi:photosynthetic reaction center H subunit